jgi:hypothetical protein
MSVETLNCNECGATIQVPSTAKYCTCNRCRAHLVVHRNSLATYTEAVPTPRAERGDAPPPDRDWRDMTDRLDELAYQNELMRLDREWEMERERYMVYGRYGYRYVPNAAWSVVGGVLAVGFGLFWTVMAFGFAGGAGGPGLFFPLFGLVFIAVGIGASIYNFSKAQQYQRAYQDYLDRRRALEDRRWRG